PGVGIVLGVLLLVWGIRAAKRAAARSEARSPLRLWARPVLRIGGGLVIVVAAIAGSVIVTMIAGQRPDLARAASEFDPELQRYKLVDTDGQPFADAALNERDDDKQLGAYNFSLGPGFLTRLAHLGWGFGPSIS